ncbi:hypothetical protein SAMN02745163_03944 [Clostridium cavendishii DSM 21758]|uniref:Uncharacterized protein n=1 Tax=Clostridium cavendishii DSM 21758 TaxID=1121302 RepID=A0A1M6T482_9CLOT|nr:hypothetical protein [Clostridium cavendishii]SHK51795.1 hypothetical protein SAMN02745163_03944 [Clostridium cavendishii DSM 21758]
MKERNVNNSDERLRDIAWVNIKENYAHSIGYELKERNSKEYRAAKLKGYEVANVSEGVGSYINPIER